MWQPKKKEQRDNLDNDGKEQLKKYDNKRKKEKRDNLEDDGKEQLKRYGNKRKKEKRDNLDDDDGKEQLRKYEKKVKRDQRLWTLQERSSIFNNVQICSISDPCIFAISAFRLIEEDFKGVIQKSPTYICEFVGSLNLEATLNYMI